jgi:NitT/TauT family transport system ATP-binding protein
MRESGQAAPVIQLDNVSKVFERPGGGGALLAVDRLSVEIREGELVAVLGKTGCGKSTMFNLISGLIEPTEGRIRIAGHDPFREFAWFRGKVGIVFQNDRLMPWRTALDNVALGLEILKVSQEQRYAIARDWLERLGLAGHEDDYPHALSGGMRQRVSLARAFAVDPAILLCDEPFSALDEMTGQSLREEFVRLVRQNRKTAVFITHSISEALQIGERLMVFHRPARIAYEARLRRDMSEDEHRRIRASVMDVLAAQPGEQEAA